jgi:nuclear transport factor 2 (NTF2) superfamily protein
MPDSNIEIVRSLITDFFNQHDPETAARFFTEDFWWTGGSVGTVGGRETYQDVMRRFWAGLPDARATENDIVEVDDTVVARFTVEGQPSR